MPAPLDHEFAELFKQTRFDALQAEKAGNYSEALRLWLVLEGYIATVPDQERDGNSMTWRADIQNHVNRLQRMVAGEAGIQQQPVEYHRPRSCR